MAEFLPDNDDDAGTPRWVKVFGTIGSVVILLVAIVLFSGHGPGRHVPGNGTPPTSATEDTTRDHAPPEAGY